MPAPPPDAPDALPDDAELAAHWARIRTGAARVQAHTDHALSEAGIPAQWFPVLHLLLGTEEHRLPMSTLARDALMTSGGFTKLADRMARDGLIDRRGSDVDRRVVHASLTPAGLDLARRASAVHAAALRSALGDAVAGPDLRAAAGVLGRLAAVPEPDGSDGSTDAGTGQPGSGDGPGGGDGPDGTAPAAGPQERPAEGPSADGATAVGARADAATADGACRTGNTPRGTEVRTARDPALPERRGRGRERG